MAKKKKSKKHNFTYGKPGRSAKPVAPFAKTQAEPAPSKQTAVSPGTPTSVASYEVAHLPEIKSDVGRVLVLAVCFVAAQIVLWYLFEHTGLGPHIYNLVKL